MHALATSVNRHPAVELVMNVIRRVAGVVLPSIVIASALSAQSISIGLRGSGSVPTGAFAEDQAAANTALIAGAKSGFGFGADAAISLGAIGIYAGFDHIKFDSETATCQADGKYTLAGA